MAPRPALAIGRRGGRKRGDRGTQTKEGLSSWPCDSAGRPACGDQSLPWARCRPDRGGKRKSAQPTEWEEGQAAVGWRPGLGMSTVVGDTREKRQRRGAETRRAQTDRQTERGGGKQTGSDRQTEVREQEGHRPRGSGTAAVLTSRAGWEPPLILSFSRPCTLQGSHLICMCVCTCVCVCVCVCAHARTRAGGQRAPGSV